MSAEPINFCCSKNLPHGLVSLFITRHASFTLRPSRLCGVKFRLQIPFEVHHRDRLARSLRDLFDQSNFLPHPI